jgi:RHS repeat-associated protein
VEDTGNPNDEAEGLKYRGSFVYEVSGSTERLGSVAWDEGRIAIDYSQNAANPYIRDEWHVRDHLGNTRMVVNLTDYGTVIEKNEYMPFGTRLPSTNELTSNRYRLGGKEEQRFGTGTSSLDLWLSDFGARCYDPFICRWTTCDPLAGKYPEWGPYNYCAGNPVNVVDPDGSILDTFFDAASLTLGVKSFVSNVRQGNVGAAIVDGVGIVADAAALAAPFASAGAGMAIKAIRGADKAADALKVASKADDVADAAKVVKGEKGVIKSTERTFQTYTKTNRETGEVYVGRCSGTGTPKQNVRQRDSNHHMTKKGFGPAKLDKSSTSYDAIRGQEQYMMDLNGGAKSMGGSSGNSINGISPNNPNRNKYMEARKVFD